MYKNKIIMYHYKKLSIPTTGSSMNDNITVVIGAIREEKLMKYAKIVIEIIEGPSMMLPRGELTFKGIH